MAVGVQAGCSCVLPWLGKSAVPHWAWRGGQFSMRNCIISDCRSPMRMLLFPAVWIQLGFDGGISSWSETAGQVAADGAVVDPAATPS